MRKMLAMSGAMIVGSFLIYCTNSALTDHDGGVIDAAADDHTCCGLPTYEWVTLSEGVLEVNVPTPSIDVSAYEQVTVVLESGCNVGVYWRAHATGIWGYSPIGFVRGSRAEPRQVVAPYMRLETDCSPNGQKYAVIARRQVQP